jgi:regulator of sigma E protease
VCFAGPFFNLLLAVLLLSSLWGVGFQIQTHGNKIILASEITPGEVFPADTAGFKTGDRILEIEGNKISYFHEIQENIALNPNKPLPITVERDGKIIQLQVTPSLEKSSGMGKIGVAYWTDIVIENVKEGSPAAEAGLLPGDIVTAVNGQLLRNNYDLKKALDQEPGTIILEYERNGTEGQAVINSKDIEEEIEFSLALINYHTPKLSFPSAVVKGVKESFKTLALSIKSLRLLFMGIDLTQAVSGPVRITHMMGDMAVKGGLRSFVELIALISIALCMMNLLPLPIIDGGMIILFLVELIRGKPAHPKAISIFQTCGIIIISCLMFFAIFGDIMFFVRR